MKHTLFNLAAAASLWLASTSCAVAQTDSITVATDSVFATTETAYYTADDINTMQCSDELYDPTHHIRPAEWITPGSAAVLSALCVKTAWGKRVRTEVHSMTCADHNLHTTVDNYLQYTPMIVAYGAYFLGWKGQHDLKDRTILLAMSAATMAVAVNVSKRLFKEQRPDTGGRNSFPSGHTATAFMGAEYLWQEYRTTKPWVGYTGYGLAAITGYLRMHNNRHWVNDVVAGAAVGMLSTKFAYWLYPKIFHEGSSHSRGAKKQKVTAFGMPYASSEGAGVNMALVF